MTHKNKILKLLLSTVTFGAMGLFSQAMLADSVAKIEKNQAVLENDLVKVVFELNKGTYSVYDKKDNSLNTKDAYFSINNWKSNDGFSFNAKASDVKDGFGEGVVLSVEGSKKTKTKIGLNIYLYDDDGMISLEQSITPDKSMTITKFSPMSAQVFASEKDFKDFRVLGGDAGEYDTQVIFDDEFKDTTHGAKEDLNVRVVIKNNKYENHNNILFTFGEKGKKQSLVYGGLSYNEFLKKAALEKKGNSFFVELNAEDPVGKLVDANKKYTFAKDKFYFDFSERNRFKALDDYGFALKTANNAALDTYTLTGLNFWYCMHKRYGGDYFSNTSVGTVEALQKAATSGFLRYGPLGIRLEPDSYSKPNNQQGWWDDEHFRKKFGKGVTGGQLIAPYDSIEKWGKAIYANGGVPLIYSQTGRRSKDYAEAFPEHMLFNKSNAKKKDKTKIYHITDAEWTYDFTDEGFIKHMRDVYANYKKGGLIGVKFDYPDTAWAFEGGFEDKYATTTSAYRNVYGIPREELGENSDIHERIPRHGDVTLGLASTQRVERDTDRFYPTFARKVGLRWYKNRIVTKYVNDVINPEHSFPYNADGSRAFYTMTYLTNARMEIGKYIELMTEEHRHQLTRVTPLYQGLGSAKPIDAFNEGVKFPQVYDLKINEDWHQVTFYNTQIEKDPAKAKAIFDKLPREPKFEQMVKEKDALIKQKDKANLSKFKELSIQTEWPTSHPYTNTVSIVGLLPTTISIPLGEADEDGGLGLDKSASYYVYDFWNNCFVGKFKGTDNLSQDLRMGESRMMSVHKVQANPQFISTDRHILQGYVDMIVKPTWDASKNALVGTSAVIEKDPYKVIIALNGKKLGKVEAQGAKAEIKVIDEKNGLAEMTLNVDKNTDVKWTIFFK